MPEALHLPPWLPLLIGALALPVLPDLLRRVVSVLAPAAALALVVFLPTGDIETLGIVLRIDALSRVFACAFALIGLAGAVFGLGRTKSFDVAGGLLNVGSALAAVTARDWLTLFIAWELLAVSSLIVLWSSDSPKAKGAGLRYFLLHAGGGAVLLVGLVLHGASGSWGEITTMPLDGPASWWVLAGVLINAGAPPLSAWVADAYPEASPSGTVFLSACTTKTAVYVLLRCFTGNDVLIWIGLWMVFYGIVYALLENDMRRILAYSIVNQVGFMVCGAGIGTELAIAGAAGHAFAHILYKGLLLMSAGAVLEVTGKRKCTELGGLWRAMPWTMTCGTIGALAISAFPLTSGFVTKSLVTSAAEKQQLAVPWFLLTAASAGVFLHAGIKFPWFVFFHRDRGLKATEAAWPARIAMGAVALGCILPGIWAAPLHARLPGAPTYHAYESGHLVAHLQLLLFAGLAFFVALPFLERTRTLTLDTDWLWRRLGPAVVDAFSGPWRLAGQGVDAVVGAGSKTLTSWLSPLTVSGMGRRLETGALWLGLLLLLQLVIGLMTRSA
ncbi:MAG: Na(+)/H(+) antiporter subunit D [Acidobacteriota bacterium]